MNVLRPAVRSATTAITIRRPAVTMWASVAAVDMWSPMRVIAAVGDEPTALAPSAAA
jgi:hypothetical protein